MKKVCGWIIYPRTKCSMTQQAYQWIVEQASLVGVELDVLFVEDIVCGVENGRLSIFNCGKEIETLPYFAIMRGYDFVIMRHIEMMGIKLFNNHDAMYNSLDKILTHQILAKNAIPTPKTLYNCRDYSVSKEFFGSSSFIVKYPKGNRGNEVYIVDNREDFNDLCNKYEQIISQEIINSSYGKDIRVWVVGNRAVEAVMRYSESSFKSNFSLGGKVQRVDITPEIEKIAVDSSLAVGLDFSGVDLLITDGGYTVCEVNGNAAFRSLMSFDCEIVIPQKLFAYIADSKDY